MQAQTSQQCVVVSFDTYCMNARGKINIYDIPILSFNISLDNPNLANLVSRQMWRLNPRTHCDLITALSGQIPLIVSLKKRFAKFINPGTPEYRNTYKKTFFVTYL